MTIINLFEDLESETTAIYIDVFNYVAEIKTITTEGAVSKTDLMIHLRDLLRSAEAAKHSAD